MESSVGTGRAAGHWEGDTTGSRVGMDGQGWEDQGHREGCARMARAG